MNTRSRPQRGAHMAENPWSNVPMSDPHTRIYHVDYYQQTSPDEARPTPVYRGEELRPWFSASSLAGTCIPCTPGRHPRLAVARRRGRMPDGGWTDRADAARQYLHSPAHLCSTAYVTPVPATWCTTSTCPFPGRHSGRATRAFLRKEQTSPAASIGKYLSIGKY